MSYRLRYKDQLLDDLPEETPFTDRLFCRTLFAAFMGVKTSQISMEHIQPTEDFIELRAARCGQGGRP